MERKRLYMRNFFAVILIVVGALGGLYLGGWCMIISPILGLCKAIDAGTITAYMVGLTVIKFLFASFVGWFIFYFSLFLARFILD